jgi:hypothetical protein
MSTKTNFKRVALVAVAAMGLGVLTSVAPANASAGDELWGTVSANSAGGAICARTTSAGAAANDGTVTRVVTTVGSVLNVADATTDTSYAVLSGGGFIIDTVGGAGSVAASGLNTTLDASDTAVTVRFGQAGTWTLSLYTSATNQSERDKITFTVLSGACASSTWSDSLSSWEIDTAVDSTPDQTESDYRYVDEDYALGSFVGKDAYNNDLPAGTWVVSATNDHVVAISSSAVSTPGALSSATTTAVGTNIYIAVGQPTTGAATSTTVTLSYNGVSVWSKALTWTGDAASITVSGVDVQNATAGGLTGLYDVVVRDAAGNQIEEVVEGDAAYYTRDVTSVTGGTTPTAGATMAAATWTCRTGFSGSVPVRIKLTNNALATIYSNVFDARCGNAAFTYTASLDKAVYNPGDLATLTITAKDASGNAPFKGETVHSDSASVPAISGLGMTPVTTPTSADTFNSPVGQKIYTFTVGNTATGKFNLAVDLGYSGNSAIAIPYEIKGDGSTSNADVLKAIVSLIASINKQIAALQKALLRR